jgi:hypothetical protein
MLNITIDVNGRGISKFGAYNVTPQDKIGNPDALHTYEIYQILERDNGNGLFSYAEKIGTIKHVRSRGYAPLVSKIMKLVDKEVGSCK